MKKLLLLFSLLLTQWGFAQVKEPIVSINSPNWQTFYTGIENYVYIKVCGYSSEAIVVSVDAGKIKKAPHTFNEYIVYPPTDVSTIDLIVSVRIGNTLKKLSTEKYRVAALPPPVIKIGAYEGGKISMAQLLARNTVYAESPVFTQNVHYEVREFTYTIIPNNSSFKPITERVIGNTFTPAMMDWIATMKMGDKLIISDASIFLDDKIVPFKQTCIFTLK